MELEDPSSLDKTIGFDDEDGYVPWLGRLEIDGDAIWLSYEPSGIIYAQQVADRQEAERARLEWEAAQPARQEHDARVREAREAGLLPDGA
jgi:hypothetical protein